MRDNPGGDELDLAKGVHRRCKKNSPSVLSCIGKRTKESCDRGSEVRTVQSGRCGEGPIPLREPTSCSGFGKRACQFITGESSMTGDRLIA